MSTRRKPEASSGRAAAAIARLERDAFIACRKNDRERLGRALDSGVAVDTRDEYGLTLLMWTARKNAHCCAELLIAHAAGIDLRHRNQWGSSSLAAARATDKGPATYLAIRAAMVAANVVLDEDDYFARTSPMRSGIEQQARGIRESDLHPNEALACQRYHVAPAYRIDPTNGC
jgi:ankyrin repeat protein